MFTRSLRKEGGLPGRTEADIFSLSAQLPQLFVLLAARPVSPIFCSQAALASNTTSHSLSTRHRLNTKWNITQLIYMLIHSYCSYYRLEKRIKYVTYKVEVR